MEEVTQIPLLPRRTPDANKGTFGRVLVVAGSRGMSGAAILAASAAIRGGAGLVCLAVPQEILSIVATANPCYTTAALPQDGEGRLAEAAEPLLLSLIQTNDVLALGPGLGKSPAITHLVNSLIARSRAPMVLDADGLNALVGNTASLRTHQAPLVLTPHPGELARLMDSDVKTVQAARRDVAARFAFEQQAIVVLKGHGTIVTDGRRLYENATGNPGMATGGTGDVLTGVIAALLAQGLEAFAAAQMGTYLHGLAGDLARDAQGETSLIASDLLTYLPAAFQTLSHAPRGH
jgi:NAD(P)H-hydrate epimerase